MKSFGHIDGKELSLLRLSSDNIEATVTNYGCAIMSLTVPDKNGEQVDVVMGFDTPQEYIDQTCYVGTVIGRCANRIKNARFSINGKEYRLPANEGNNHLHGGTHGFWNVLWDIKESGPDYVIFEYLSPDGEEGYPGNFHCTVEYRLDGNKLCINYSGISDADTIMNLTHHGYYNLNGHQSGTIEDHIVMIDSDAITEIDSECISTGNILPLENTPFDLRTPRRIGDTLPLRHVQLEYGGGFNHNYVLDSSGGIRKPAASLYSPDSGICMEVFTDLEGVHYYTSNYLDGTLHGKEGAVYDKYAAVCFETQHFPNAVNIENFPSPIIKSGDRTESTTIFAFSVR